MRFQTRLTLCAVLPPLLFVVALAVALSALMRSQQEFDQVLDHEQKIANGFTEMYAQGLQMGQATRNILLDPSNPKAKQNLDAAQQGYATAYDATLPLVKGSPLEEDMAELARLRLKQADVQQKVLDTAKSDSAAAIALLNREETPAWRDLRGKLLKHIASSRAALDETRQRARSNARRSAQWSVAAAALALVAGGILSWFTQRTVRRELGGDPVDARNALRRLASGDLSFSIATGHSDDASLFSEMRRMQDSLRQLVSQVQGATKSISNASVEIAQGNVDLSSRTEQAAANLQQTAASMEQFTGTIQHASDSARQANQMAASASEVATRGGQVVAEVITTMDEICAASKRIADIIGVIDGIAFQTNILALNAAVEAARAGEQGRGFAVVAGEVRSLARRSAEAAHEIKALIGTSVDRVEAGSRLVQGAGTTMDDIVTSVRGVSQIIGEISHASLEQNDGIKQVNTSISYLDRMTQQNAALVEQAAAAADSLKSQAHKLTDAVSVFRLEQA